MAIHTIRSTGYQTFRNTVAGRLSGRLADGTYIAMAFEVSGTQPQILFFTSPDNFTWTLRNTINSNDSTTTIPQAMTFGALAVDDSDNVHIVASTWQNISPTQPGVSYWMLTKGAGLSWTAGSRVTIQAPNFYLSNSVAVDIDFVGAGSNGRPIISVSGCSGSAAYCRIYMIVGGASVLLSTPGTVSLSGNANVYSYRTIRTAAITGRHQNEGDNTLMFLYTYLGGNGTVKYALAKVNNTGTTVTGYNVGTWGESAYSRVQMSWVADREVLVTYSWGQEYYARRFSWDATPVLTQNLAMKFGPSDGILHSYAWSPYIQSRDLFAVLAPSLDSHTVRISWMNLTNNGTSPSMTYENLSNLLSTQRSPTVYTVSSNFNRSVEWGFHDPAPVVLYVTKSASFRPVYASVALRSAIVPTGIVPVSNSRINRDTPNLAANVPADANGTQSDFTVTWQFATEPSFAAPIESTYQWVLGGGRAIKFLEVASKLTSQGTWYIRAKTTNRYGDDSDWSPVGTFENVHLPVPIPLSPKDDRIVPWNSGSIPLDWDFSDTSPTATQSAYQVVVVRTDDGSTVLDTGKVTSAATAAVITLDPSAKDLELAWSVSLWDDQDVQGPASDFQPFYASDPPAPTLVVPTPGQVVVSGVLMPEWDSGISGVVKTQARWRIVLQEGSTVIHDSGTRAGSDITSYRLPVGSIHTGHAYVIFLTVWDTLNLAGSTSVAFSAVFTQPSAATDLEVFTYNFELRGYVWLGWTNVHIDPDFVYWNVYRRAEGEADWTLLETVYENQPFYGFSDFEAAANTEYEYVVTQVINAFGTGDLVESQLDGVIISTTEASNYWLIDPSKSRAPVPIFQVIADAYTDEWERSSYTIVGRGRHTDVGDHLGVSGTITTQARDHAIGAEPTANVLADPSFQHNIPFSPEWTVVFELLGSVAVVTPLECPPSGHDSVLRIDASRNKNVQLSQHTPGVAVLTQGDLCSASIYLDNISTLGSVVTVSISAAWLDHAGAVLGTQTANARVIEDWKGFGNWIRYGAQFRCNLTGAALASFSGKAILTFTITDTSDVGLTILANGTMFNFGDYKPYGDADSRGWKWDGAPYVSSSYTNGFYSARDQRRDIVALVTAGLPRLKLRNPFGDLWPVSVADIAFARLSGVGSNAEFGDITIPYSEQAE